MTPADLSKHPSGSTFTKLSRIEISKIIEHMIHQELSRYRWKMISSHSTTNSTKRAWRFQRRYRDGSHQSKAKENSPPRHTRKFWKKTQNPTGVYLNPKNWIDTSGLSSQKTSLKGMMRSQLYKPIRDVTYAQSFASPQDKVMKYCTESANKQSSSPSTPWQRSQSREKHLFLEPSKPTRQTSDSGAKSTQPLGNGYLEKSSTKSWKPNNKGNFTNRSPRWSTTKPAHSVRITQPMLQKMTLPEASKVMQVETHHVGEEEVGAIIPEYLTHQQTHPQVNSAEPGHWRHNQQYDVGGSEMEGLFENIETTRSSLVRQDAQAQETTSVQNGTYMNMGSTNLLCSKNYQGDDPPKEASQSTATEERFIEIPLNREDYLKENMNLEGLNEVARELIGKGSVKKATARSYNTAWKSFAKYCNDNKYKPEEPVSITNWMAELDKKGMNQKSIRTYCVAVCSTIETATTRKVGQERLIELTLKSLKISGSKTYKNQSMWDVQTALESLKSMSTTNFHELSQKTVFLIALCTCWRPGSDLSKIEFKSIRLVNDESVELHAYDVKEGESKVIALKTYTEKVICPVNTIQQYIEQTTSIRSRESTKLFITKKGKDASSDTLRRWIAITFTRLGIDTRRFKPHSTRATASSTLVKNGTKISEIIRMGNWSSANVFRRYYWRPMIETQDLPTNTIQGLLQSPNDVLPSNNEGNEVILSVIREKATATTPHPPSPRVLNQKRAGGTPEEGRPLKRVPGCGG